MSFGISRILIPHQRESMNDSSAHTIGASVAKYRANHEPQKAATILTALGTRPVILAKLEPELITETLKMIPDYAPGKFGTSVESYVYDLLTAMDNVRFYSVPEKKKKIVADKISDFREAFKAGFVAPPQALREDTIEWARPRGRSKSDLLAPPAP